MGDFWTMGDLWIMVDFPILGGGTSKQTNKQKQTDINTAKGTGRVKVITSGLEVNSS